jgi:hypothetical protein
MAGVVDRQDIDLNKSQFEFSETGDVELVRQPHPPLALERRRHEQNLEVDRKHGLGEWLSPTLECRKAA